MKYFIVGLLLLLQIPSYFAFHKSNSLIRSYNKKLQLKALGDVIDVVNTFSNSMLSSIHDSSMNSFLISDETTQAVAETTQAAVSIYSKVDKTGFIGFLADYVERAIDFGNFVLTSAGINNAYGYSIILFTILVKIVTLPLQTTQIESTTKLQKLTPLQQKIQAKYKDDEQTKNQLLSQLFQVSNVNPLAGCFPALVQIPIFISLYRALQNLVAENKLNQPFLWIPDLEGPVYMNPPETSLDWVKSIFSGQPLLGWSDTIGFLSIPIILYVTQTLSQKVLQPPRDPNKVLTEQEEISQGLLNYLPVIFSFFSLNVPAGLGIYWIANNILTTIVTITIRNQFKDEPLPPEVEQMMAMIEGPGGVTAKKPFKVNSAQEFRGNLNSVTDKKTSGFGKPNVVDTEIVPTSEVTSDISSIASTNEKVASEVESKDDDNEEDDDDKSKPDETPEETLSRRKKKTASKAKSSKKKRT